MILEIPLRTVSALNARENWRARAKRVKGERQTVAWALTRRPKQALPCRVTLTRIGPSNGLDPMDNLPSSLKGVADQVAEWLGVNDRRDDMVRFECRQERGPHWYVRVEIEPMNEQSGNSGKFT